MEAKATSSAAASPSLLLLLTTLLGGGGCRPISFPLPFLDRGIGQNLSAVVLVADGTEEMEAVTTIDVLRRAGIRVTVAGVEGAGPVICQQGVVLTPDRPLDAALLRDDLFDLVVVPGGEKGCDVMAQSADVGQLLKAHAEGEKFIAATTAGPLVLDAHKINFLKRLTSAPEYASKLKNHYSYYDWEETIVDRRMVTGRFAGTLLEFSLALVNHLTGRQTANRISYDLQPYSTLVD